MTKGDTARTFYESARTELIQRIQLRDNALVLFLGAISAIFGFSGKFGNNDFGFFLIIPYLAFGAATIVEHHNSMIGLLGLFLSVELGEYFKEIKENAPQWDTSSSLLSSSLWHAKSKKYFDIASPFFLRRKIGHWILLLTPSIVSLVINYEYYNVCNYGYWSVAWWLGAVFTILTYFVIRQSSQYRAKLYSYYKDEGSRNTD